MYSAPAKALMVRGTLGFVFLTAAIIHVWMLRWSERPPRLMNRCAALKELHPANGERNESAFDESVGSIERAARGQPTD